ncbi:MAG: RNA 2',3'-cyclic phosphodiesterase [Candidatus Micrarchaeota archaeon]|nr:RNA 2',3'-cyclic phosphodiesterase [Candidatus Micrarchaeota archaeon]MDE1859009.1 RNA 2',3'-cyclic phosphodiesterase [Candidatus Micrarchaeota archaeon]
MRAFTGIDLPDQIKESIAGAQARLAGNGIVPVNKAHLHITMHFFPQISDGQAAKVINAIDTQNLSEFEVEVKGVSYFGGSDVRVVYAGVEDPEGSIKTIYDQISSELSKNSVPFDVKGAYLPHVTIARSKSRNPYLRQFIADNLNYEFGRFAVKGIFFKKSVLTQKGPVYTDLYERQI